MSQNIPPLDSGYPVRKNSSAVDAMMETVVWEPTQLPEGPQDLPYVTHEGVLEIDKFKIRVIQLNTGQRIIPEEEIEKFFCAATELCDWHETED